MARPKNDPSPQTKKSVNTLFTSVGRRVELLRAFRRAYQALGLGGRIVAVDIDPLAPALNEADRPCVVPTLDSPGYVPTLINLCQEEKIDLVFPLIDPDIPVLAAQAPRIEATGARVAVVSPQASALTTDKWLTHAFLEDLGLPGPRSWLPQDLDLQRAPYPLFIKPRRGSAGRNAFQVNDPQELSALLGLVPEPIIQERLPGPEITSDVICDLEGEVLAVVSRQRLEVRWGEVAKGKTVFDPAIIEGCLAIARALPAKGPITVQCMIKAGRPRFTEINARFGGGAPLGFAAGVDSPRWLLARTAGLAVDIPPLGSYQTGLYMTRFDDSFFLTEAEREQMAGRRL